jgi:cobalamin biosynthesis Co2+ chelatase CbiK
MPVKKKVYVAAKGFEYEGNTILGVFTTPEKAHERLKDAGYRDYVEIQVFTLNGERLYGDPDEYFQQDRQGL